MSASTVNIKEMSSGVSFYHYTSTAGANGIRKDELIRSQNGVMLSTLNPEDHSRRDILHNIHGNSYPSDFKNRADNVVFVNGSTLDHKKLHQINSQLYKYSGDIRIKTSNVRDKPACTNHGRNNYTHSASTSGCGSFGLRNQNAQTLYYYTDMKNASQIKSVGYIAFNKNVLTTLKPENHYQHDILKAIYGGHFDLTKAYCCIKIDRNKLSAKKLKRKHNEVEVYEYSESIDVNPCDVIEIPRRIMSSSSGLQDINDTNPKESRTQETLTLVKHNPYGSSHSSEIKKNSGSENVHQRTRSYGWTSDNERTKMNSHIGSTIKIQIRSDIEYDTNRHQDDNVTIFGFHWLKDGLQILRQTIKNEISLDIKDYTGNSLPHDLNDFNMKYLQIVARNESSNINGKINFGNYIGINDAIVYSLKDLVRQSIIVGKDLTTHYGGYPHGSERVRQEDQVYVCDLIGLQFQHNYNTGRLVIVGENTPKGVLDDFIYEHVVNERKPTIKDAKNDNSGRFVLCNGVFFDVRAYVMFVANDVFITGMALNECATEPLNFKFLKYGTGYFAGQFRDLLEKFIGDGVAKGLQHLLTRLPKFHKIRRIELPFFERNSTIDEICERHNVELTYGRDDSLKKTHTEYTTATTNCADPHAMTGNKMGFGSIDGAIAQNIQGKAIKFSPIINKLMKECYIEPFY